MKTYAIIGKGPRNESITEWSKKILTQGKWEPEKKSDSTQEAPYSFLSEQHVTFLFAGTLDEKVLSEELQVEGNVRSKLSLLEETVRRVTKQHNILPMSLKVDDLVCFGDSKNCIALRLDSKTSQATKFHEHLMIEINKLNIFNKIGDRFPFSIHITLGYKRMDPNTFKEFESEVQRAITACKHDVDREELTRILEYSKKTPLSQIHHALKKDLIRLGCSEDKLNHFQNSLAVSEDELKKLKDSFMEQPFCKAGLEIHSVLCTERPITPQQSVVQDKELFVVKPEVDMTPQFKANKAGIANTPLEDNTESNSLESFEGKKMKKENEKAFS